MKHVKLLTVFTLLISSYTVVFGLQYVIGPDDVLEIKLWGEPEIDDQWVVSENGNIDFPLLGRTKVAGLTVEEVVDKLNDGLSRYYKNPQVMIKIVEYGNCEIYVLGEVKSPGVYHYQREATAMEAILMADGFTRNANKSSTLVIRNVDESPEAIKVDMDKVLRDGMLALNVELRPGDVVYVPERFISNVNQFISDITPSLLAFIRVNSIYRLQW